VNTTHLTHLELAKKIIRDKKVEGSITECQRILRDDPQLVAHAMYAQDEDLSLFQSLVATKTIERKMALLKAQGKPHNYKHHVNCMAQYKIHPSEILEELTTDIPEIKRILFALATIDLFLSNRAPDLYTNSEALTVLLNQEATRLPDTNCLTDWSLFALIENFSDNLEKFTLPAPVLNFRICLVPLKSRSYQVPPRSKCPTPTAVPSSVRPTLTESPSFQDGGSGVSNVSTPNPRAEVEVEFDPNSVSGDQSASRSTSASPGAPLAGVPGGVNLSGSVVDPQTTVVNLSSEALTQEGEPLGPCACGGCFPGLQLESIPSEGGEKTGSMPALEATRAPPMGTPCGSVYFPPGASSEGRGRYPDLGSRRSNGVPQSPCCGDGMDSPSTPVTGGLAPAFLVTNGTEPAATNRVAPCAEPPRTGEEEEKSQEDVDMVSGDAEGKDSTETEALTDEGNTQIHSEVDGSGDINGQAKPCDTPGEVIQEEQSTNNDNDQSNQDIVDKSVAQGNGAVDPPTAADKIQGDQEQQNAEKANPWTQKTPGKDSASSKKDSKQGNAPKGAKHRNTGAHAVADDDIARCEAMADTFYKDSGDMDAFIENILLTPQSQVYELTVKLGEGYKDWSEKVICDQFVKENPGSLWGSKFPNILIHKKNPQTIVRLPNLPRTPQVKKLSSAAALKMSNANSCSELRETNTHGVTIIPGIVSPHPLSSSNQDGGSGVSNVSTPNPRAEVEVEFDPNSVSGDQSASRSTSASPGAPLAGVPGGVNLSGSVVDPQTTVVNLSSEALTQEGEPLGPCACGGCFPGLQLESIPSEGGEKTGSMPALEATRAPPMGTPCGASSEGRGRYPDLGSRRSNGVPQSPCCGDGMDSPSTPVTGGLAPAFLVTNGTEPAATNRVAPCAEPPRTGEEEEKSQEDVDMVSGDAEGKDSTETEALTDEGNTQIHSEVDGSGDINGQAKSCDTPGEVIHEEQSTNNDNDQSNQDIVDKSVAQGNGAVDPPTAADKIQGDQEQQNAEKANPWTQKAPGKDSASSKKDSKQGNAPKGAKHRNTGAHAIADDDIARCEAMADTFYKDSGDMDAFIENILLTPQSQVYELTVKLGEGYKDWSEKVICDQFVKENPGSLWGSKFPNILIHKKNPQTIVISSYNLSTCVEMGGTTFRLGGKDFLVPKYSRYGNNYYVTFNKVSHPSMAKAIVKKMAVLTKSVIAAFNPTAGQNIKSPHLRVIFKSSAPPAVLVPKSGDALREITITDPSGQPFVVVFQHKIAALNKTLPPSIVSRRAEAKAEKAKAKAAKAAAKSPPSGEKEPEHDGDDHDQDPGTNAEGKADSTEASEDGQDEQPQPTAPSHGSDVDMSGDSDPPNNNGQDKQQEDVEMSTNESPALAPPSEQPKNSLDLQLVTGYRSGPAPKRTLPSSPRLDPLPTSNRFHILEEDDVELSFEDFAVPRIVLEDSSAPRPKKTKGKAKKQRLNKSAAAHLELAKKIIRDKKVEGSITECQRILRDDPQLVAHAMYAQDEDLSLFQSLVATKTIERKMALLKAQGKPHNYKHHVNFMAQYKIHPSEILEELTTDIPEIKRILFALATIDLFLSNRAPDLYTNSEALTVLLNQEATRLPDTNCLTDWSLFALIENFSDNLEKFTLPAPVLSAISMLKSITNNYHIDELCSKAHHSMNADEIDPLDLEDDQL
ncbi:hypothetical protein AC1031_012013, partial [Aphanomyces cochlioides]